MLTASAFLILFSLGCLLALVRHPVFGLMAYLATFYLHPPSRWWGHMLPELRWSLLAAAVTFVGYLIHKQKMPERPVFQSRVFVWIFLFILWVAIQFGWALDERMQFNLLDHYVKFAIAAILIYKCVDSEQHLRLFLWAHLLGCFAFGWTAFMTYAGGRFEAYGGPGFADANFAGIQAVTGIFAAGILILAGKTRERIAVILVVPFVVNSLVTTMSRSSFLALIGGGLAFLWFCPPKFRARVVALGALAVVGFMMLSNEAFWERMQTITYGGQEVQNVDTGGGRVEMWKAQMEMFTRHPIGGCGHRCTATLSSQYLDDRYLTGPVGNRARSSHNTYFTLLVEQGVIGGVFFLAYLYWLRRSAYDLHRQLQESTGFLACALPGVVAILIAISVADVFVDYLKLEVRVWYICIMLALGQILVRKPKVGPKEPSVSPATGSIPPSKRK